MSISLSDGEILITHLLCDMIRSQNLKLRELDAEFIQDALFANYHWALKWKYSGLFPDRAGGAPPEVRETSDILYMWRHLDDSFQELKPDEQEAVLKALGRDDKGTFAFPGFDANNDPHYGIAIFMVDKLGAYEGFKGAYINSHSVGTLPMHRRMLPVYQRTLKSLGGRTHLNQAELIEVMQERTHPSQR